jgi:hypothetical protein
VEQQIPVSPSRPVGRRLVRVLRVVERLEEKSRAEGVSLPLSWSLEEDLG